MKHKRNTLIGMLLLACTALGGCSLFQDIGAGQKKEEEKKEIKELTLDKQTATVKVGETLKLTANYPDYTGSFLWRTTDETIASVDQNGVVTGVSVGSDVIISVKADDNMKASCSVSVIPGTSTSITYSVNYYCESLTGEFVVNPDLYVTGSAEKGTSFTAEIKTVEGFTFDADNPNNKTSGTLDETTKDFSVYYTRNEYNLMVNGGTAAKVKGKYEEEIAVTPLLTPSTLEIVSGKKASINGMNVKIGVEDVEVNCVYGSSLVLDPNSLIKPTEAKGSASINIKDKNNLVGIVFGYTSTNISQDGVERYYLAGVKNNKIALYENEGSKLTQIKESESTITDGTHKITAEILADYSVKVSVDDVEALTATVADINAKGCQSISVPGHIGGYSENKVFSFSNLKIDSGSMTIDEAKTFYKEFGNKIKFSLHDIDCATFGVNEEVIDINLKDVPFVSAQAKQFETDIDAVTNFAELETAMEGTYERKYLGLRDRTYTYTYQLLDKLQNITLSTKASQHEVLYAPSWTSSIEVPIYFDYRAYDNRWWTPTVYKLNCGTQSLLPMFESELFGSLSYSELYALSDKYCIDLVRALCYKNLEFFYWDQYSHDSNVMINEWWFLWDYNGAKGANFNYVGNVFAGYQQTEDYRIAEAFFEPTQAPMTIQGLVSAIDWMLNYQTVAADTYVVTLNTMGGNVASTTLTPTVLRDGNNQPYGMQHVTLPTPTRAGYEFDGWYSSRMLQGSRYLGTDFPADTRNDVTLYAAWKQSGARVTPDVLPADYITENMIIQQNKPIVFSGTGTDGILVSATFGGETRSATITDGAWKIVFDAKKASYTPYEVIISGGDITYSFKNCLIGELWLGTGQSNMEMLPVWLNNRGIEHALKACECPNITKIRVFRQKVNGIDDEDQFNQNRWVAPSRGSDFFDKSMLSYKFASELQKALNIPVGVLTSCRGGTYIEEWMSEANVAATYNTIPAEEQATRTSLYYNGMTVKLANLQCAGVIWYQGENNWDHPTEYKSQYKKLVEQYRTIFDDANLPIIAQQLVQYVYTDFSPMRLAQWEVAEEISNAYCSCSIDTGEWGDIHPEDKDTLAKRMSNIALEKVYGKTTDTLSYAPISAVEAGGKVTISFAPGQTIRSTTGAINNFKVVLSDESTQDVQVSLVGNTLVFDAVSDAQYICYGCSAWLGEIFLYGGNDLPVTPFKMAITK